MPVITKPVDPNLKSELKRPDDQKRADQARDAKNMEIDNQNKNNSNYTKDNPCPGPGCPSHCPGPNCPLPCPGAGCPSPCPGPNCPLPCPGAGCPIPCSGPNCPPPSPCPGPNCPLPCPGAGCPPPPPPPAPVREIVGYDSVCDDWRIGVLVNRHFKQSFEWKFSDIELDKDGEYRYCAAYRQVPRFKYFNVSGYNTNNSRNATNLSNNTNSSNNGSGLSNGSGLPKGANIQNTTNNTSNTTKGNDNFINETNTGLLGLLSPPTIMVNKIKIEVPCSNELNIVLNDRNFETNKETQDSLGRKCTVWVNSQTEVEDYKKHEEFIAKQMQIATAKQLAFRQMIPLRYD